MNGHNSKAIVFKVDTQGAEVKIFKGGSKTLSQAKAGVLEFCPYHIKRLGGDEAFLIDFLEKHFSHGVCILPNAEGIRVDSRPIQEISAFMRSFVQKVGDNPFYVDVFVSKTPFSI